MELKIYDKQGLVKMIVSPDGSSQWNHEIGVENVVTVNFTTWEYFVMEVGFYILVEGVQFRLKSEYKPKHIDNRKYTYNLKFYGREHDMQDILFCRLNQSEDDFESVFAYDCTPMELLQKVVDNMNRNSDGIVWKAGEAVPANRKTINFNGLYCWDALSEGARAFETEWWMDGEYLNLSKCLRGESVLLGYGQGLRNGLVQNENSNSAKWFTRLIPVGSSRNIDRNKYGYSTLQLPGREKYIDVNTQQGLKEYREDSAFSEIYPHREGSISSVRSELKTNEETGDFTVWYVKDESLPFNPDEYMIPNEVIHMTFNTGSLAGKEFEVNWDADKLEFEIINQYPDDNTQIPGGNLVPKSGDKYVLTNISMPDEYIQAAELQYKEAVDVYIEEYSKDISIYSGNTDYIYVGKNNVPLQIGQRVVLVSEQYFDSGSMETRITRLSRKLNNLGDASFDCSNAVSSTWKSNVDSSLNQLQFSVAQEMAKTIIDILKVGDSGFPSDYNVLSSLRSLNTFLRKDKDDQTPHNIGVGGIKVAKDADISGKVNAGDKVTAKKGIQIGSSFVPGMLTGSGGLIDEYANAELESLIVRRFFEAPELRFNRVEIKLGDKWNAPGAGVIESVVPDYDENGNRLMTGTAFMKLEEGEYGAIAIGDICMGIFHSVNSEENAIEDRDDSRGNFLFSGFYTCYFTITEITGKDNKEFRYQMRPVSDRWNITIHPSEAMNFVCYGSFTRDDRQTSVYTTRTYTRLLKNQNTWEIAVANIAMQYGDLTNMNVHGLDMTGYSIYLNNIYMSGIIRQVKPNGDPILTANDKGPWEDGTVASYYDRFSYEGSLWLCVNESGTNTVPSKSDPSWLLQVEAGVGITSAGHWNTINTPYKQNTIVDFAGSVFISNKNTSEAPFPIYTDNNGNRLTFNDGGYVLAHPLIQIEDWNLLLSTPDLTKGEDGKSIEVRYSADKVNWHSTFEDGDIWMQQRVGSDGTWSASMRIVGETGKNGTSGLTPEFEFAVNTSLATAPTTGWQDAPPSVGIGQYLWMRQRIYDPNTGVASSWTVARIKGDVGEGYTTMGSWKSGMTVPKMGVVTMYGSVYTAKVATTNPPLWCYTDNNGNRLLYKDGGYVLTGEVNTSEYELWIEKPVDGKDGKEGKQGIQGCIIRDSEWALNREFRNDEDLTSGTRFLDVVLIRNDATETGWESYKCKKTHISSTATVPPNTTYWEAFGANVNGIFTSFILAKNAKIKFLQGNQLLLQKTDGTVTAGLSGSEEGDKVRFWAGSSVPDDAPFSVTEDGTSTATKFRTGKTGLRLEAANGLISVFGYLSKNIEFGVDNEGMAVMRYYDNNGILLYDLGPSGIKKVDRASDSWVTTRLAYVGNTLQDVFGSYLSVVKNPTYIKGIDRYQYLSGFIGTAYTDPVNDRRYFTEKKVDSEKYIEDGWYVRTAGDSITSDQRIQYDPTFTGLPEDLMTGNPPISTNEPIYVTPVIRVVDGKIIDKINAYYNLK